MSQFALFVHRRALQRRSSGPCAQRRLVRVERTDASSRVSIRRPFNFHATLCLPCQRYCGSGGTSRGSLAARPDSGRQARGRQNAPREPLLQREAAASAVWLPQCVSLPSATFTLTMSATCACGSALCRPRCGPLCLPRLDALRRAPQGVGDVTLARRVRARRSHSSW